MRVDTQHPKLATLLNAANDAYNDNPKASSRPRDPKMVFFMAEADRFVSAAASLSKKDQVGALKDLARLSRNGEVAVSQNAADVLRDYAKRLGEPVKVYAARLTY